MINRSLKTALCVTSALAGYAAAPAYPQAQHTDAGSDSLTEIVVTARRVEESVQNVPISISVFSQQQLQDRNVVTTADLATYTPSLSMTNAFGIDNASFAIRGFVEATSTTPSVGVFFADVVAPRAQGGLTAGNGAGVGSFFDLQNVQVLKGPQGTLFGRNTTGGSILLVPQKPTSELGGYVEESVGNYGLNRTVAVANLPLNEDIRFRLGVDHEERDGYLHNVTGIGPNNFADVDYTSLRASMVIDITPNLENYTIGTWVDSQPNGDYPKAFNYTPGVAITTALGANLPAQIAATSGSSSTPLRGTPPTC
jgi:iron complex outermembrane receptor protein